MSISPRMLDWTLNGVPVYIRRRPVDCVAYATTFDFRKFIGEEPIETVRLKLKADTPAGWDPTTDKRILKKLAEYNKPAEIEKARAKRDGN